MTLDVFNRHENKYLIDDKIYEKFQQWLPEYMETDHNNKNQETYSICSLYYDTADDFLIRTSLNKPRYREKLRLRSYGTPDLNTKVYLEIKKKVCGLGNKRRSALRLYEANRFLESAELPEAKPYMNQQVLREIQYILHSHQLFPKVFLAYERRAYFVKGKHDLRVSFDTKVVTRRRDLKLESGIYGETLLEPGQWIMEIKTAQNMPLWLARLLSECRVYPTSFSKYGTEYKRTLARNSFAQGIPSYDTSAAYDTPTHNTLARKTPENTLIYRPESVSSGSFIPA